MNIKQNTRIYSDFDLNFRAHPLTGDIALKFDEESVKRSIRNLVSYNKYEKAFNPRFGSDIRNMLFENATKSTAFGIEARIKYMLLAHEPRVNIIKIKANPNSINTGYDVTITFSIVNIINPITTTIFLQRIR